MSETQYPETIEQAKHVLSRFGYDESWLREATEDEIFTTVAEELEKRS